LSSGSSWAVAYIWRVRIALDATYSLGADLSGVGVYSRELLSGLAASNNRADQWDWFYRSQRYWRALRSPVPPNIHRRFLSDTWGNRSASLFHGLNQRLPKKRFKRQIATFHDLFVLTSEYSTAEFRERFTSQAREAAAAADLIVAVSTFTARQVDSLLHVPRERIRVIHHGVVPRVLPLLPRENMVLCVGAIQRRKNQAALIRAFRAMPSGWTLVLAGSLGFDAQDALREAEQSPRSADIRITGYLSETELAALYAKARIFAFPSLDEGFGMPVLEAMAAGIPVIAGNRAALPEVCGNGALLINPENEEELVNALRAVSENTSSVGELLERGRFRAAEFTWAKAIQRTLDVYRELTASHA
jgi:glycosyltransferase involved in cell wall biosynthesis